MNNQAQWKSIRTSNAIERLHEEFKRRIKTQTVLPSADRNRLGALLPRLGNLKAMDERHPHRLRPRDSFALSGACHGRAAEARLDASARALSPNASGAAFHAVRWIAEFGIISPWKSWAG
jgi:hypothetical protein